VATREAARARLFPAAARALRARDFRTTFGEHSNERQHHSIILALPDDTMKYVFDRLAESDCRAVVVMARGESFDLALVSPASPARVEVAIEDDALSPVHENSDVAMFFEYLRLQKTVVVQRISARFIDESDTVTV
jgi:hypothetical protein